MNAKSSAWNALSIFLAIVIIACTTFQIEAAPKKKKKDKYDYITVTVYQQFSKDLAYMNMKRGSQSTDRDENRQFMINISFEGDENSKEIQQRFFEQYSQNPTLPLAIDYLGDLGWDVSTTNQILVDGGLLMTTVILQKPKK